MPAQDWSRVVRTKRSKASSDANAVSIAEVVRHFGGEVKEGRNVSVRCCMHDDSRKSRRNRYRRRLIVTRRQ